MKRIQLACSGIPHGKLHSLERAEPWQKTANPIILLHLHWQYVQHTVQSTDQSTHTGKKCHADDNPSPPFFSLTSSLAHTQRYLQYFQSCCLGDHSLFRCVVKETKMAQKKKSVLLKFLEYPSAWLELGKSNAEASLDECFQWNISSEGKKSLYWFCYCVINIKMEPGCCK